MEKDPKAQAADPLTLAAEKAVESQMELEDQNQQIEEPVESEPVAEEPVEPEPPDEQPQSDPEGLPKEHKERSDLGRKVSAVHRRMDEMDNKFDRVLQYLESQAAPKDPLDDMDENEPITRKDLERWQAEQVRKQTERDKKYNDAYYRELYSLGADLPQEEYDAIVAELHTLTYNPSQDPLVDAQMNFLKAERAYLRKKSAQPKPRPNPLKGSNSTGPTGVVTTQKTVETPKPLPKLSPDAQAYLDFVRSQDGDEKANKLLRGMK